MSKKYAEFDLEEIVYKQLENLNAMHDLQGIVKFKNNLIQTINQTLSEEIGKFQEQLAMYAIYEKVKIVTIREVGRLSSFGFLAMDCVMVETKCA